MLLKLMRSSIVYEGGEPTVLLMESCPTLLQYTAFFNIPHCEKFNKEDFIWLLNI